VASAEDEGSKDRSSLENAAEISSKEIVLESSSGFPSDFFLDLDCLRFAICSFYKQ
jgi:hypothetical protein